MNFQEKRVLGRTGLSVGRLGISSSFGAPADAFEEAFERGCNYFTWGSFFRGRSSKMKTAIKNIVMKNQRDDLVVSVVSYAHNAYLTEKFFAKGLKDMGIEYADVLLLGYFSKQPSRSILEGALRLKEKGLVRFLGITSHNRKLLPELHREGIIDVFHIRYNAANRGAEVDAFPSLTGDGRPGIVSFTATRWRQLLKQKKMPENEKAMSAADCYRFVLSNPSVDVCMVGASSLQQMRDNLTVLESGPLTEEELSRVHKIGDFVYNKKPYLY